MSSFSPIAREERVDAVRHAMAQQGLQALVVFDPRNIRYLTGFTGEDSCVVITPSEVVLVSDFRFRLQAGMEAPSARLVEVDSKLADALPGIVGGLDGDVGVESSFLTLASWLEVDEALSAVAHLPVKGIIEKLREVKTPAEIERCREAGRLAAEAMGRLLDMKVVGRSEREVALDIEMWARKHGSGPMPFDYIVAAGPRGAMPHGVASEALIPANSLLVVDMGVLVDGYASDMTRTFATGRLSDRELEMYAVVRAAQEAGRAAVKAGVSGVDADRAARAVIDQAGMGEFFQHSLGHGVGLEIHEAPRLGPRSTDVLASGHVVTVEPGVYVQSLGGVRIEDTVVVGEAECEILTEFSRDIVTLG